MNLTAQGRTHITGKGDGGGDPGQGAGVSALVSDEGLDCLRLAHHARGQQGDLACRQHRDVATWRHTHTSTVSHTDSNVNAAGAQNHCLVGKGFTPSQPVRLCQGEIKV